MRHAWHEGSECHHRAHACGRSLTLYGWATLWWQLRRTRTGFLHRALLYGLARRPLKVLLNIGPDEPDDT